MAKIEPKFIATSGRIGSCSTKYNRGWMGHDGYCDSITEYMTENKGVTGIKCSEC